MAWNQHRYLSGWSAADATIHYQGLDEAVAEYFRLDAVDEFEVGFRAALENRGIHLSSSGSWLPERVGAES
jgi:hypothetical protein